MRRPQHIRQGVFADLLAEMVRRDVGVHFGRGHGSMAEQFLNFPRIASALHEQGGAGVAQHVGREVNAASMADALDQIGDHLDADPCVGAERGEQIFGIPAQPFPILQVVQQDLLVLCDQGNVTVFLALSSSHEKFRILALQPNVRHPQVHQLHQPNAGQQKGRDDGDGPGLLEPVGVWHRHGGLQYGHGFFLG